MRLAIGEAAVGFPPYTDNPGDYQLVSYPEADRTDASKLNNFGLVVGTYTNSDFSTHGFIYDIASDSYATLDQPYANLSTTSNPSTMKALSMSNSADDDFPLVTDGSTFARFDHPLGATSALPLPVRRPPTSAILGAYIVGSNIVDFVATRARTTWSGERVRYRADEPVQMSPPT